MRRPTIRDVAAAAGVSISTASKALNGQGKLRAETRDRVAQAARQLDFAPNTLAQALLAGRSFTVGLITTDSFGRFSIPVMLGAEDALGTGLISVFMCDTRDDPERERRYIEMLSARRVDGLIVTGRRIAHVAGPERFLAARLRARGFSAALAAAGVEPCGAIRYGEWGERWGREAAGQLLADQPDAIFCGSDQIARGVADTLRAVGRRVPEDVALVGFDNWDPMTLGALPPLTSVDPCLEEVGRVAAGQLLAAIGGERPRGVHKVPSRLSVRESSGG